jgi:hypothetical protein
MVILTMLGLCTTFATSAACSAGKSYARTVVQLPLKSGQYLAADQECSDDDNLSVNGLVLDSQGYNGTDFELSFRRITQVGPNKFRIIGELRIEESRKPFSEVWTVLAPDKFWIVGAAQPYRWCKAS